VSVNVYGKALMPDSTPVTFSAKVAPARQSRYTLTDPRPTAEGGKVGVGVDRNGNPHLVHEVGRATEAIALHAVATAIAAGAIPVEAVVGAFVECDSLPALSAAVATRMPKPSK
jgi:hypothetical protein